MLVLVYIKIYIDDLNPIMLRVMSSATMKFSIVICNEYFVVLHCPAQLEKCFIDIVKMQFD